MENKNARVDELLKEYEAQNGENSEEKVYVAYKRIADESCCSAACKGCACLECCG